MDEMKITKKDVDEVRPIHITDTLDGREYTLEFDKKSVKFADSRGFALEDVDRYPMSKMYELFWYSFRMHHPSVSMEKAERIFDGIGKLPDGFIQRLAALYTKPFTGYTEDSEENPTTTVVM